MLGVGLEVAAQSPTPRVPGCLPSLSPGTSATLLPDGQCLVLGGQGSAGPVTTAQRYDPAQQTLHPLAAGLRHARSYHTATLLADGQVLVLGGTGLDGLPIAPAELFNPDKGTFQTLNTPALMARTRHGATLLVDGRLLITGGSDTQGAALAEAELWNPFSQQVERFNAKLDTARLSHLAALLPDHNVLIWGGVDSKGVPILGAELYDPQTQQFVPYDASAARQALAELDSPEPPNVVGSAPADGATDVRVDQLLSVRFSKPLAVTSLHPDTVVLIGPDGQVPARVTPTEGGLVVFLLPTQELFPSADYALMILGAVDGQQQPLPPVTITFRTQALGQQGVHGPDAVSAPATGTRPSSPASGLQAQAGQTASGAPGGTAASSATASTGTTGIGTPASAEGEQENAAQAAADGEAWIPGPEHRKGQWRSGRAFAHSRDTLRQQREFQDLFEGMSSRARDIVHTHMSETGELQARAASAPLPGVASTRQAALGTQPNAINGQVLRLNGQPLANVTLSMAGQHTHSDGQGEFLLTGVPLGAQILSIDGRSASIRGKSYGRFDYRMEVKAGLNELDFTFWMPVLDTQHAMRLPSPTTQEVVVTNPHMPGFALHIPPGTVIRDADGKVVTEVSITPIPADQIPFPMPYADVPIFYTIQPGGAVLQAVAGQTAGARLIYPNYSTQPRGARFPLFDYDPRGRGWYIYTMGTVSADGKVIEPEQPFTIYQFTLSSGASPGGSPPDTAPTSPAPCQDQCGCDGDPVSCADGLFLEINTDLHLADILPLGLTRTYRQNDANQRAYGVGTNHDLDLFLTFVNLSGVSVDAIEMILAHGGRVRFEPTGTSHDYTSAIFASKLPGAFYKAQLRFVNDGSGNAFWVTLKDGRRLAFSYYQSRLKWIEDRYGNRITVFRDGSNRIDRLVSPQGRYITLAHQHSSCSSCITTATDNIGRVVHYGYDIDGRLTTVTDPQGGITTYTYDTAHRMLTVTDRRLNRKVLNEYDANGRVKKQTYADNTSNTFAYTLNAASKVTQTHVTHERGDVRRITYNSLGYLSTNTLALGRPEQQVFTYPRNAEGLIAKMIDPLGRVTAYEYDTHGNVTKVTRLFGTAQATSWTYTYEPVYNQLRSANRHSFLQM